MDTEIDRVVGNISKRGAWQERGKNRGAVTPRETMLFIRVRKGTIECSDLWIGLLNCWFLF